VRFAALLRKARNRAPTLAPASARPARTCVTAYPPRFRHGVFLILPSSSLEVPFHGDADATESCQPRRLKNAGPARTETSLTISWLPAFLINLSAFIRSAPASLSATLAVRRLPDRSTHSLHSEIALPLHPLLICQTARKT